MTSAGGAHLDRPLRALTVGDPDLEGGPVRPQPVDVEGHPAVVLPQLGDPVGQAPQLVLEAAQVTGEGVAALVDGAAHRVQPGLQVGPQFRPDVGVAVLHALAHVLQRRVGPDGDDGVDLALHARPHRVLPGRDRNPAHGAGHRRYSAVPSSIQLRSMVASAVSSWSPVRADAPP